MANTVSAFPAKRFFVEMLTRDIELQDAILDLLDNCVDGALRQNQATPPQDQSKPYVGRQATISFNKDGFTIEDNCGGIPRDLAETYAFRMGRPDKERDASIPTVGMYGIGMKRAIFKIGKASVISSQSSNTGFKVDINAAWMEDDADWSLPIPARRIRGARARIVGLRRQPLLRAGHLGRRRPGGDPVEHVRRPRVRHRERQVRH